MAFSVKKNGGRWKTFQERVLGSAEEVCGLRKLAGRRRTKCSEYWNVLSEATGPGKEKCL